MSNNPIHGRYLFELVNSSIIMKGIKWWKDFIQRKSSVFVTDLLSGLCQDWGRRKSTDAAADDDGVEVFRDFVDVEALLDDGVALLAVRDVRSPGLPVILNLIEDYLFDEDDHMGWERIKIGPYQENFQKTC